MWCNLERPLTTHADHGAGSSAAEDPVAICGIGVRLPGGIRNTDDFWEILVNGKDTIGPVPPSRFNINGHIGTLGDKNSLNITRGYFLDEDLTCLDTSITSMTREEVEKCDPQQRQLLEVTKEALDDAGELNYRGKRVGCYVGNYANDWMQLASKETLSQGNYVLSGQQEYMLANRISYEHDLRGPSQTVNTACSSAIVALHEACRAIQCKDADAAIVAASSIILTPTACAAFFHEGVLSPDGSCKTFDESANGFGRADAINAIYIKSLSCAIRDGNPIRAVIRGIGSNCEGKSLGITNPTVDVQAALIESVYQAADLDPRDTAFVECHGTGTPVGDVVETTSIGMVFGEQGVMIGAVKPNVGHAWGASGLNSLIKAVLALEHRIIPPNIKFENPNPKIAFEKYNLKVPTKPTAFPRDRAERISVNSFGLGGTNAHVVLDAYRRPVSINPQKSRGRSPELLLFSSRTQHSLESHVQQYEKFTKTNFDKDITDVAFTLATRREQLPYRGFAVVSNGRFTKSSVSATKTASRSENVYFVFTGQGAQWSGMARELLEFDVMFRNDIEEMEKILANIDQPPGWSLLDELTRPAEESRIGEKGIAHATTAAIQIALVNKLRRMEVRPDAVVGHSSGEIVAAYAAGFISMSASITIAYYRGDAMKSIDKEGAMAAIGLRPSIVGSFLTPGVEIACENSASSTTISGDSQKVVQVMEKIEKEYSGALVLLLQVPVAYHSDHMVSVADTYETILKAALSNFDESYEAKTCLFSSTVLGTLVNSDFSFDSKYWAINLRSKVKFASAVETLLDVKGGGVFLEIGPHSTLAGPLRQICESTSSHFCYDSMLRKDNDSSQTTLSVFGTLFQQGVRFATSSLYPAGSQVLSGLLPYAWDHRSSFWYESRMSKHWRHRHFPHHCLLGSRTLESPDSQPQWRNMLSLEDEPWIADHKVQLEIVLPFAAYIVMAGEAIRQLSDQRPGYSIKHMRVETAMVLSETDSIEVMTTLNPYNFSDVDTFGWYEFAVSSYNGTSWTSHATGLVRSLATNAAAEATTDASLLPRKITAARYYDEVDRIGIQLGQHFQKLGDISTTTSGNYIMSNLKPVRGNSQKRCEPYTMHPCVIDAAMQLILLTAFDGSCRKMKLTVPIALEELDVLPYSGDEVAVAGHCESVDANFFKIISDGKIALQAKSLRITSFDDDSDSPEIPGRGPYGAARIEWVPDFNFADHQALVPLPSSNRDALCILEELTLLCILDDAKAVKDVMIDSAQPHLTKLRSWLQDAADDQDPASHALVPAFPHYRQLSRAERAKLINERYAVLLDTNLRVFAEAVKLMHDRRLQLFSGEQITIEILYEEGWLARLYDIMTFNYGPLLRFMANSNPNLRILEVGAGTGSSTELILRHLAHPSGAPQYFEYTFTDISSGFFPQAQDRLSFAHNINFAVLDISKDPGIQGLRLGSYDVVIASSVVHATPYLRQTLTHINSLLRSGGKLILGELCTNLKPASYVFGHFDGWWLGTDDNRTTVPYVSPERWNDELVASEFTGNDFVVLDDDDPNYTLRATIVSSKVVNRLVSTVIGDKLRMAFLITLDSSSEMTASIVEAFQDTDFDLSVGDLVDELPSNRDVIISLDIADSFEQLDDTAFIRFQKMVRSFDVNRRILWLVRSAETQCDDMCTAYAVGIARTLRTELGLELYTLETKGTGKELSSFVLPLFDKITGEKYTSDPVADSEYAIVNGAICVARYQPFTLLNELAAKSIGEDPTHSVLEIHDRKKTVAEPSWVRKVSHVDLVSTDIEVETRFAGLNFHDLVLAKGLVEQPGAAEEALGLDFSGVVSAVGAKVDSFKVGDRVFGLTTQGACGTRIRTHHQLAAKMPEGMDFQAAATVGVVFVTAMQTLLVIGKLQRDQTVLVHLACGGLGQAAMQVCRMVGAQVYATVGSEAKVDYLIKNFDIPRERILDSRSVGFQNEIMKMTEGHGIDLVLNSLSGELLHASWNCVAQFGTMIDVSMQDTYRHLQLSMHRLAENRTLVGFYGRDFLRNRKEDIALILQQFLDCYVDGLLNPIPCSAAFAAGEASAALSHLQSRNRIGKVVLDLQQNNFGLIVPEPWIEPPTFDPDATYLFTGGMGGLGRSMAVWLVEHGAKSLTFLSRNAGRSEKSRSFVQELKSMGCRVSLVVGRAEHMPDVLAAVSVSKLPVKGVFHLAMVPRDSAFLDMTWEQWRDVVRTKVQGAWNLHNALKEQMLDIFWLAGSLVNTMGHYGQANYAAATNYLETFCRYRIRLGLPASILGICPIRGVGYVAENPDVQNKLEMEGVKFVAESHYLDFVHLSILARATSRRNVNVDVNDQLLCSVADQSHILMGLGLQTDLKRTFSQNDRRMGYYRNFDTGHAQSSKQRAPMEVLYEDAQRNSALLDDKANIDIIACELGAAISELLMQPGKGINSNTTLAENGVDSLMASELRRWIQRATHVRISVRELTSAPSLAVIAGIVARNMKQAMGNN